MPSAAAAHTVYLEMKSPSLQPFVCGSCQRSSFCLSALASLSRSTRGGTAGDVACSLHKAGSSPLHPASLPDCLPPPIP